MAETAEYICHKCNEGFQPGEEMLSLGQWTFHQEHFVCYQCGVNLAEQQRMEKNEDFFCMTHYHEKFSPKCEACNKPLTGNFMELKDKKYHQECLVCSYCKGPFPNGKISFKNDKMLCENCNLKLLKVCKKCNEPIQDVSSQLGEDYYHVSCIICTKCGSNKDPKTQQTNFIVNDGKLFHAECFQTQCPICKKQIIDVFVVIDNDINLHKECVESYKEQKRIEMEKQKAAELKQKQEEETKKQLEIQKQQLLQKQLEEELKQKLAFEEKQRLEEERKKMEANKITKVYPYEVLVGKDIPKDVIPHRKEEYLADDEFQKIFKMTKKDFQQLKKWQQESKKKEVKLF